MWGGFTSQPLLFRLLDHGTVVLQTLQARHDKGSPKDLVY